MRHPTRDLRAYVDDELEAGRREAVSRHLDRCPACRCELAEERRLRSRLRAMVTPDPMPGLGERIAASAAETGARPKPDPEQASGTARTPSPATARGALAVAAGLGLAGAAVIAGSYVIGNNMGTLAEGQRAGLASGWAQASAAADLDSASLDQLRASGWTCPELASLGFEVVSARAVEVAGQPAIELQLSGGNELITVYEQRRAEPDQAPDAPSTAVNALSGRTVAEDGFTAAPESLGARLWKHPENPAVAVLASSNVTYTIESSRPDRSLSDAVQELALTESARLAPARIPDTNLMEQIVRGLREFSMPGPSW